MSRYHIIIRFSISSRLYSIIVLSIIFISIEFRAMPTYFSDAFDHQYGLFLSVEMAIWWKLLRIMANLQRRSGYN